MRIGSGGHRDRRTSVGYRGLIRGLRWKAGGFGRRYFLFSHLRILILNKNLRVPTFGCREG